MVKRVEASGKTTEDAIRAALAQLGCTREEVTVEELVRPRSGFFGIGAVEARVAVTYIPNPTVRAREFLEGLLERMDVKAEVVEVEAAEGIAFDIRGENMGVVIGRRGDTLDALQYITSIVVNRGSDEHIKVTIDTENYRAKREESLANLANKVAARVLRYHKSVTLEPMNAYERRIIHSTLQNTRGVTTFSTGTEPNRRVVVALVSGNSRPNRRTGAPRQPLNETTIESVNNE